MENKKDYRTILTEKLIEQLEAGTAPWQKPWDAAAGISRLPYNPATGKEYRGANSLYLSMHGHNDPRWATYKQAAAEGWQVRKGEKGALIEYWKMSEERPMLDENTGKPIFDDQGKPKTVHVTLERPQVFRAVVFNASQMDGVPELTKEPRQYEWDPVQRAEQILEASGAKIYHDQNDRAFYRPSTDQIHLPGREQFPSESAYYSTALHELGHWTGHETRLDRDLTGGFGSPDYAKEELRAELSSYFMADKLGIQHDPGQHAAYVGSWIKVLKEDKNEIFRAAKDAEKITEFVLQLDRDRSLDVNGGLAAESPALSQGDERIAAVLREVQLQSDLPHSERQERLDELMRDGSVGSVPIEWTGDLRVSGTNLFIDENDNNSINYVPAGVGESPQFYGVFAQVTGSQSGEVSEVMIATTDTLQESDALTKRLSQIYQAAHPEYPPPNIKLPEVHKDLAVERTALTVPFKEKEQAKQFGAKWDKDEKQWYVPAGTDLAPLAKWLPKEKDLDNPAVQSAPAVSVPAIPAADKVKEVAKAVPAQEKSPQPDKVWLAVPFKDKNQAKEAGAKWDVKEKAWYAPAGADMSKLQQWAPKAEVAQAVTHAPLVDPAVDFGNAIRAAGLELDGVPEMDGKLHRIPVADGKRGNRDGAYVGYLDGRPAGSIHNWASGEKVNWKLEGPELTGEQRAELAAAAVIKKQMRAAELSTQHNEAADKAGKRWDRAATMPQDGATPYLERKQVEAFGLKREGDNLLIPARDIDGKLWSIQTVFPEKKELAPGTDPLDKVFTKDAKKEGNFHLIGEIKPGQPVITMEGYATGASVHKATGYAVAVAFDSGNLDAVVGALKERYPTNPHFIGADDDRFPKPGQPVKNAGLTKATEAAQKHEVGVIVPVFSTAGKLTDFNDLHVSEGLAVVKQQIEHGVSLSMENSRQNAAQLAKERLGPNTEVNAPGQNTRHTGTILGVSGYHAAQATSTAVATIHQVKDLEAVPAAGQVATIQYQGGRGKVTEKAPVKQKELQR
ncbi:putative DNA primase/helicase [Massilia sp. MP_M2]|uniref:zincin-like metallopeptidase domain-containing protein n=1 Tax=Massilia sp. MP_M2 TaxID=3071713 RepID=UPI00319E7562